MMVVDFTTESMVGINPQAVVRPGARRLNSKIPRCLARYNAKLEELLERHRITEKVVKAHLAANTPDELQATLNAIDSLATDCMLHAEKKCRKFRNGTIPFSPEASIWIKRMQFYRTLLRFQSGKGSNRGNLKRAARRCKQVSCPFSLTVEEISGRLQECKRQCKYFQIHGQRYQTQHLNRRLDAAREKEDEDAERRILQIIRREKERNFLRRLNWALGKRRGASISTVQVQDEDGNVRELTTKDEVEEGIWSYVHHDRYHLAEEAPICQGKLRGSSDTAPTHSQHARFSPGPFNLAQIFTLPPGASARLLQTSAVSSLQIQWTTSSQEKSGNKNGRARKKKHPPPCQNCISGITSLALTLTKSRTSTLSKHRWRLFMALHLGGGLGGFVSCWKKSSATKTPCHSSNGSRLQRGE